MTDLSGATTSRTSDSVSTDGGGRGTARIIDKVRDTAAAQLTSQKNRATDGLGSISQAVRQSTHQLRDQEHDVIAHYIEQAADQIDRFSRSLRDKDVGDLARDMQRMAQRRPALFIGGAFAVGLLGARFWKSSSRTTSSVSGMGRNTAMGRDSRAAGLDTSGADLGAVRHQGSPLSETGSASTGTSTRIHRSGPSERL
jgi:hypothetical protein